MSTSAASTTADGFALNSTLLRVEAVAHELQICRTSAFKLVASGQIESIKIGASRRVPREALDSYIKGLRATS